MCKCLFGRNIYVRFKFSCVRLPHDLCASVQVHSLEGTLVSSDLCAPLLL